jgi:transposase InsO family protein
MSSAFVEQWVCERGKLRRLLKDHPSWSTRQLVEATAHSQTWVKDWKSRFRAHPDDDTILLGHSYAPHTAPPRPNPVLVERILDLRSKLVEVLGRIPGPKTLLYYLTIDPLLQEKGITPPRSTSTIYKIMVRQGCYERPGLKKAPPKEPLEPLECIAFDFKDVVTVEIDPDGKQQHLVEVLNLVDEGTSVLWEHAARDDFNAQTVVETLLDIFEHNGLPRKCRFDRDPRFVGAAISRDFPSALVRMFHVLGVTPLICPPHRPDKNGFVERYNKTLKYECLLVSRPENLTRVRAVIGEFKEFYNYERPHQGKSCQNRPPRVAFPQLPALPLLPVMVDPDCWLTALENEHFTRKVSSNGSVQLDKYTYFLKQPELKGKYVVLEVQPVRREVVVFFHQQEVERFPLRGLYRRAMPIDEYRAAIIAEAKAEQRGWRPLVESAFRAEENAVGEKAVEGAPPSSPSEKV